MSHRKRTTVNSEIQIVNSQTKRNHKIEHHRQDESSPSGGRDATSDESSPSPSSSDDERKRYSDTKKHRESRDNDNSQSRVERYHKNEQDGTPDRIRSNPSPTDDRKKKYSESRRHRDHSDDDNDRCRVKRNHKDERDGTPDRSNPLPTDDKKKRYSETESRRHRDHRDDDNGRSRVKSSRNYQEDREREAKNSTPDDDERKRYPETRRHRDDRNGDRNDDNRNQVHRNRRDEQEVTSDNERDRNYGKRERRDSKDVEKDKGVDDYWKAKRLKTKENNDEMITTRTGGAYIPPARLRMMQEQITDKSSVQYQRMAWEALKKSIHGLINKVTVASLVDIVHELFQENIVRGRGLLSRSIMQAQSASPTFTHVFAALVAIINTKFPQIGELILKRLVIQFRKGFKRNDKNLCLSSVRFIAHLVNQQVAHEIIALEVLTLLLEKPTDDSVEVAVGFLKESGSKLTEVSPRGIHAIFDRLRTILHEATIDKRVQYMIEVMFAIRKDGFKDHLSVITELDLVDEDDQFTHMLTLEDAVDPEDVLNVFKVDNEYVENEEKYKSIKKEILNEGSSDEEGGEEGSDEDSSDEEGEQKDEAVIIDNTETNLIALRRTIYLTIQSSLDFEECAHKLLKMQLKPGQEVELCNMILDCCAQQRTYEKFFGLLAQRFCMIERKFIVPYQAMFREQYETIHRLETNKLRNVAKFFAHLLHTDAISWEVLQCVKMSEDDTTSSSRIFIKILFQELSEYMGLTKLNDRLKDVTLQPFFEGIFPRDNPRSTRFAINFFTSIGLGGLTDELRDQLKAAPKPPVKIDVPEDSSSSESESSDSSDSDSESESSSDSESDSKSKGVNAKKPDVGPSQAQLKLLELAYGVASAKEMLGRTDKSAKEKRQRDGDSEERRHHHHDREKVKKRKEAEEEDATHEDRSGQHRHHKKSKDERPRHEDKSERSKHEDKSERSKREDKSERSKHEHKSERSKHEDKSERSKHEDKSERSKHEDKSWERSRQEDKSRDRSRDEDKSRHEEKSRKMTRHEDKTSKEEISRDYKLIRDKRSEDMSRGNKPRDTSSKIRKIDIKRHGSDADSDSDNELYPRSRKDSESYKENRVERKRRHGQDDSSDESPAKRHKKDRKKRRHRSVSVE